MRFASLGLALVLGFAGCGGDEGLDVVATDGAGAGGASGSRPGAAPPAPPPVAAPEMDMSTPGRGGVVGGSRAEAAAYGGPSGVEAALKGLQVVQRQSAAGAPGSQTTNAPAMLIRTGHATVEIDSLEPAIAAVQALALRVGGFVANIGVQSGRTQLRQATLELKVPAARFDEAVEGLQPIGKIESMSVSAEDVGEEYTDIEARVSNARRLEERLLNLLATRTGRLEDVLAAERELSRVRQEIERYEGRMRFLRSRIALSTLHITVHEPAPIIARSARNPILEAFRGAWRNFVAFVAGVIELMGVLVPVAALALLVTLAWRRWGPSWRRGGRTDEAGVST